MTVRTFTRIVVGSLAALGLAAALTALWLFAGGIGAKQPPGPAEVLVARHLRSFGMPTGAAALKNPVAATPDVLASGMAHFADHCAVCHANDGSGDTEMGRGLYPRAPDMRGSATQALSDGALFYIIENGVRFTGMPAWGTGSAEGEQASWRLVHFIRHLPQLRPEELAHMRELNPKGPDEWRQQIDPDAFLRGDEVPSSPSDEHEHKGK